MATRKILIIGLGLIGGSLARSVKENGYCQHVMGYGHRDQSLKKGIVAGVIDSYSLNLDDALMDTDIVVVAAPTLVAEELLRQLLPRLDEGVVITDVASVKGNLLEVAREVGQGSAHPGLVLGHPIAGSERSGVDASRADLFVDHKVILTPTHETDASALATVREMWAATGADVVELGVREHDAVLAATSHLPHMLAFALVDALAHSSASDEIFRFAAGGFRDFTRIASSDPVMWRDIALANREQLLQALDCFSGHVNKVRSAIDAGDGEVLHKTFTEAKAVRDAFANKEYR